MKTIKHLKTREGALAEKYSEPLHRYRHFFDAMAGDWDRYSSRSRGYRDELTRLFKFLIPPQSRIMEIGCATGDLLYSLEPRQALGIDFSPAMLEKARRKYPLFEFRQADAEVLPSVTPYDYVVMADLLGVLPDVQVVFEEIRKVSSPRTRVLITHFNYLWEPVLRLASKLGWRRPLPLENWLPHEDIANLLRLSGFEIIKTGQCCLLPLRIPGLSRLINRWIAPLPLIRDLGLIEYVVARPLPERTDKNKAFSCSVIVPCRNERGNIRDCIRRLPAMGTGTELIFVDGNSTDGTIEEIEAAMAAYSGPLGIRLLHQGKGTGKGDAVRKGFAAATGDILMILDADLTVVPEDLPKFFRAISEGRGEFINGTRLVYPLEKEAMRFLNLIGNRFFSLLFTWIFDQRIRDTLCGTKVFFKTDYEKIVQNRSYFGDFDPFGDFDLLFGAAKQNLKIIEIPVRYKARTYGDTKISRFRHGWLLLRMSGIAARKLKFI